MSIDGVGPTSDPGMPVPPDPVTLGPQCTLCLKRAVDAVQVGGIGAATGPGYAAYACRMCAIEEGVPTVTGSPAAARAEDRR